MALKFTYREDHSVLVYDTLQLKLLSVALKEYCGAITNVKMTYGSVHFSVWKNLSDWVQSLPPKGLRKACHAFTRTKRFMREPMRAIGILKMMHLQAFFDFKWNGGSRH